MKKKLLPILLFPLLLAGCSFDFFGLFKKKSSSSEQSGQVTPVTPEEHYIDVLETDLSLEIDEQYQLTITELKKSIIICQSSNEEVATVSQEGLVMAISPGEATISISGGKDQFNVFVTVLPPEAKDSLQIVLVKQSFTLSLEDDYVLPLTVKLGNEIVLDASLDYEYETEGIVSISGLTVTPLSVGTTKCVVTASYNDMVASSSFTISVY